MECEACGYEVTKEMSFCPRCGDRIARGKVILSSADVVVRMTEDSSKITPAQWELLQDFACKFSEAAKVPDCDADECATESDGADNAEKAERREKRDAKVRALCHDFLSEAEKWMDGQPESPEYSKRSMQMLAATEAASDISYVCCDMDGEGNFGYAVTDEGFYFIQSEKYEGIYGSGYSFEQLEESDIRYESGFVHVCDDCVYLPLSEWEAKKLYELLKAIVREFEISRG